MLVGGIDCRTDASPLGRGSLRATGIDVLAENERAREGADTTAASAAAVSDILGTGGGSEGDFRVSGEENDDGDVTGRALFRRLAGEGGGGGKEGGCNGASGLPDGIGGEKGVVIEY